MLYLDSETCGLHGFVVLLQYAYDDGPIQLYCPWRHPVRKTLNLVEEMMGHDLCGFNLTFDMFHLCKLYTTFRLLPLGQLPQPEDVAAYEQEARDGPCVKPKRACDIMLVARKTEFQSLMDRKDIRIRRVPTALAQPLANELEHRIRFDDIFFARRKKARDQWQVFDIEDEPDFKDVVLKFAPTTALKALAKHALGAENILTYKDVDLGKTYWPEEVGYAPFAYAINSDRTWPHLIDHHINHWTTNEEARRYAANDVIYTRDLYKYFGSPESGDDDSELACMVAACRWRGYAINVEGIRRLRDQAELDSHQAPTSPAEVRELLKAELTETELVTSEFGKEGSTKKQIIEKMEKDFKQTCPQCKGVGTIVVVPVNDRETVYHTEGIRYTKKTEPCSLCKGSCKVPHRVCEVARRVKKAREARLECNMLSKLLQAGRFHADFKIIGTLSSRMSGSGGLNPQAINSEKRIRSQFRLADPPDVLCGGDFSSFEIVLAIAAWKSKNLEDVVTSYRECHKCMGEGECYLCPKCKGTALLNKEACEYCYGTGEVPVKEQCFYCKGKKQVKTKIHAMFGTYLYPDMTYEQIVDSDGTDDDRYTRSKSMLFALMYGAEAYTLANRGALSEEQAEAGYQRFIRDFPDVGAPRKIIFDKFATMKQMGGLGSKIEWSDPEDYIEEPVEGHRRYFTLENRVVKTLYSLASSPPKAWLGLKIKVQRRERVQTISGAVQSALYACAFQIQSSIKRAAANHVIQASGAKITKRVQRRIWDIQPHGVNNWRVQPFNVHDELQCPTHPDYIKEVTRVVKETVESFKDRVPLLAIDWNENIPDWSGKKS